MYGVLVEGGYFGLDCGLDERSVTGSRMEEAKIGTGGIRAAVCLGAGEGR